MKVLFLLLSLSLCSAAFGDCVVGKTTKGRISGDIILKGSVAVSRDGKAVGVPDILKDVMIFFRTPSGETTQTYQWMYNPINKVENRDDKYLATSFGEDVIVTVGLPLDEEGKVSVVYTGTRSGNYLTLVCDR